MKDIDGELFKLNQLVDSLAQQDVMTTANEDRLQDAVRMLRIARHCAKHGTALRYVKHRNGPDLIFLNAFGDP